MSYRIINGTVLLDQGAARRITVDVQGEKIDAIDAGGARPAATVLDAAGLFVLPGIIDIHGDGFERSLMPRPGVFFDHALALAETDRLLVSQGITTAYLGLTVSWEPGLRSLEAGRAVAAALARMRDQMASDVRLQIRWETFALDAVDTVTRWLADEPRPMLAFNDHTTQTLQNRTDPVKLKKWAERSGLSESQYLALLERVAARAPDVPEAVSSLAATARAKGVTMLSHDDRLIETRDYYRGLGATVAEFPLTLAVIEEARARGEQAVLGAPNVLRGGSHIAALDAADMVEAGLCTVLASDYYYPSQLAAAFKLIRERRIALDKVWPLVSRNVAQAAGLEDRGVIAPGRRADLVIVDPDGRAGPLIVATIVGGQLRYLTRNIVQRIGAQS